MRKLIIASILTAVSVFPIATTAKAATLATIEHPNTSPNYSHVIAAWNDTWANYQIVGSGQYVAQFHGYIWNNGSSPVQIRWAVYGPQGLKWSQDWTYFPPCSQRYWSFPTQRSLPKGAYTVWYQVVWGAEITTRYWSYEVE